MTCELAPDLTLINHRLQADLTRALSLAGHDQAAYLLLKAEHDRLQQAVTGHSADLRKSLAELAAFMLRLGNTVSRMQADRAVSLGRD